MSEETLAGHVVSIEEAAHPWGVEGADGDKLIHKRDERVTVATVPYRRWAQVCGSPIPLPLTGHFHADDAMGVLPATAPEVRCGVCLGPEFTLHYGSYEIAARCIACGHEDVVYSG